MRSLIAGSMPDAREILALPEVGAALVGSASLKATKFKAIFWTAKTGDPG
jgi:triosephosphate isomerase